MTTKWLVRQRRAAERDLAEALALGRQDAKRRADADREREAIERDARKVGSAIRKPAGKRPTCVCASCPASIWYDDEELRCFCSVMKIMSYEPNRNSIKRCDGRTLALARLETAQGNI